MYVAGMLFAGYVRVSRVGSRGERLISPAQQGERIRSYADARGLEVELLDAELDVSGGKIERPILSEALAGIEEGRYGGIIVAQLDRLSRMDIADALQTIKRIEAAGGKVIAVAENFDVDTPEGRLGRNVFLALGEMQLDRYRGQFAAAKEQAVARGIWPLPIVPVGYRRREQDRRLEPDPEKAPLVVRAFEARAGGASWREVGGIVDRGYTGARKVIGNRVYLGEINYGQWANAQAHEPIIGRALFESAQLAHPRPPRGSGGPALLTGLLRCCGCRGKLTPDSRQYRCHRNRAEGRCAEPALIARSVVEPYVERAVLEVIGDLVAVLAPEGELTEAGHQLDDAEAELAAYEKAIRVSELGVEKFAKGFRLRSEAVEKARRRLGEAKAKSLPVPTGDIAGMWPQLSVSERRQVLGGAVGVIWVRKGRGPAESRVRLGSEVPLELPRPGFGRSPVEPMPWDDIEDALAAARKNASKR